ncbi:M23 family metallopeptidase [candidate division WOR-3 bacterium]|nr:M23 family metallopeptidase [candidate division WOR-3 bacterium]
MIAALFITAAVPFLQQTRIVKIRQIPGDSVLVVSAEAGAWAGDSPENLTLIKGTENFFLTDGLKTESGWIFSTCGSGLLFIGENSFERWGFAKMGPFRQYCASLTFFENRIFASFADGLCEVTGNSIKPVRFFESGRKSYALSMSEYRDKLAVSCMAGIFALTENGVDDLLFPDSFSLNKPVHFLSDSIAAGSNSAFWIHDGSEWILIDKVNFVNCFYSDSVFVYLGAFDGITIYDRSSLKKIFSLGSCPVLSILKHRGRWLFGTAGGLYADSLVFSRSDFSSSVNSYVQYPHPFIMPPFPRGYNNMPDQTYLFSSTFGGKLRVHKGIDFNNPGGTPVLAGGDGIVVSSGTSSNGANYVTVRYFLHREEHGAVFLYTHFREASCLKPGDTVSLGDTLGLIGHTGRATNDHLHLEARTQRGFSSASVNPSIWLLPAEGTGAVSGRITQNGFFSPGLRIYGFYKPGLNETPFLYAETYSAETESDPELGENFFIDGILPGFYRVELKKDNFVIDFFIVEVKEGKISWIERDVGN